LIENRGEMNEEERELKVWINGIGWKRINEIRRSIC